MNLSEHFSLDEFIYSKTAELNGIDNTPPSEIIAQLTDTAQRLEAVRSLLCYPIHINSGYRSPALNKAVGGVSDSAHLTGHAADIVCHEFGTPLQIIQAIDASNIEFDQCIQEGDWCHISFSPPLRRELLTAHFVDGKATYAKGI